MAASFHLPTTRLVQRTCTYPYQPPPLDPDSLSIRHQSLCVHALQPIKSQRIQHRLIMEPIQIYRFSSCSRVRVLVPRRHAESVALSPGEFLAIDRAVACSSDDVVDGGGSFADCRGCTAGVETFGAATQDFGDWDGALGFGKSEEMCRGGIHTWPSIRFQIILTHPLSLLRIQVPLHNHPRKHQRTVI